MSDPLRTDSPAAADALADAERRVKIEELLLVGLDHYFKSEHEQAINVWTRVLFLDRSHARARAYIERARSALAERQRQSEELLHHGVAAFERGEVSEARQLLQTAISQGAPREEALAVLDRLTMLEQPSRQAEAVARPHRAGVEAHSPAAGRRRRRVAWWAAALIVTGAAAAAAATFGRAPLLSLIRNDEPLLPTVFKSPELDLDLPTRGQQALDRARTLAVGGRLHDALASLDVVKATDPQKADADRLRAEIQRQLVALATVPPVVIQGGAPDGQLP